MCRALSQLLPARHPFALLPRSPPSCSYGSRARRRCSLHRWARCTRSCPQHRRAHSPDPDPERDTPRRFDQQDRFGAAHVGPTRTTTRLTRPSAKRFCSIPRWCHVWSQLLPLLHPCAKPAALGGGARYTAGEDARGRARYTGVPILLVRIQNALRRAGSRSFLFEQRALRPAIVLEEISFAEFLRSHVDCGLTGFATTNARVVRSRVRLFMRRAGFVATARKDIARVPDASRSVSSSRTHSIASKKWVLERWD